MGRISKLWRYGPDVVISRLPPRLGAWVDFVRPWVKKNRPAWGKPLNGQIKRQEMVREMLARGSFRAIVETGTFRGTTTEFLCHHSGLAPVYTIEINPRYFHYARIKFRKEPRVHVTNGDSRQFLHALAIEPRFPKERVLFYLDAHWDDYHPLHEELSIVSQGWEKWVVMIDDFQVPDDPGYGFGESGPEFTFETLPLEDIGPCRVFWPMASSREETGARRGCVVLVDQSMSATMKSVPMLRPSP